MFNYNMFKKSTRDRVSYFECKDTAILAFMQKKHWTINFAQVAVDMKIK